MLTFVDIEYVKEYFKNKKISIVGPAGYFDGKINDTNDILVVMNDDLKKFKDVLFTSFNLPINSQIINPNNWPDDFFIFTLELEHNYRVQQFYNQNIEILKNKNIKVFLIPDFMFKEYTREYYKYSIRCSAVAIKTIWCLIYLNVEKIFLHGVTFYMDCHLGLYNVYNKSYNAYDKGYQNDADIYTKSYELCNDHTLEAEFLFFYDIYQKNKEKIILDEYSTKLFEVAIEKIYS
jgi:hypothetical protein